MVIQLVRGVFFVLLIAISVIGLLVLLPLVKEGASREDIPLLLGGVAVYVFLGIVWWLIVGRALPKAALAWIFLVLPCLANLVLAGTLLFARLDGERTAQATSIESYAEEMILWPGFDGPVGLRMVVDLSHPSGVEALLTAPEVRMGPAVDVPDEDLSSAHTWSGGYFKAERAGRTEDGPLTLLKSVGFQRLYENPDAAGSAERWLAERRFPPGGESRVVYHLFPGHIDYLESEDKVCLTSRTFGLPVCEPGQTTGLGCVRAGQQGDGPPIYALGADLSALWAGFGSHDMVIDLSDTLTRVLRQKSRLQGDPDLWSAMQKRMEPAGLQKAGYEICPPGDDNHSASRICYCRGGSQTP
jgi:hypothetical protein